MPSKLTTIYNNKRNEFLKLLYKKKENCKLRKIYILGHKNNYFNLIKINHMILLNRNQLKIINKNIKKFFLLNIL